MKQICRVKFQSKNLYLIKKGSINLICTLRIIANFMGSIAISLSDILNFVSNFLSYILNEY